MGTLNTIGKWVGSNLLGILFSILVVALVGGFLGQLANFPRWSQALLVVVAVGFLVEGFQNRRRLLAWLRRTLRAQPPGPVMSLGHAETGGSITASNVHMNIGPTPNPPALPRVIASGPTTLRRRSEAIGKLAADVDAFHTERWGVSRRLRNEEWNNQRQYDAETAVLFKDFDAEILEAYADACARGFAESGSTLEHDIRVATTMGYMPMQMAAIVQRLKVIAIQMEERAIQIEEQRSSTE
jgi:hypothetical protein